MRCQDCEKEMKFLPWFIKGYVCDECKNTPKKKPPKDAEKPDPNLKGIKGWLLVVQIYIGFLTLVGVFVAIGSIILLLIGFLDYSPYVIGYTLANIIFPIVTGAVFIMVFRKKKKELLYIQRIFLIFLGLMILGAVVTFFIEGYSQDFAAWMWDEGSSVLGVYVLYAYFTHSDRVKNTFTKK